MATKRIRERVSIWLNLRDDFDFDIADYIHSLKKTRSFTTTFRAAFRLIADLRAGRSDVLRELFPHIVADLEGSKCPDSDTDLGERLARLERALLEKEFKPKLVAAQNGGPKPMAVPQLPAPVFDDDLGGDTLVMKSVQNGHSAANFMRSVNALAGHPT